MPLVFVFIELYVFFMKYDGAIINRNVCVIKCYEKFAIRTNRRRNNFWCAFGIFTWTPKLCLDTELANIRDIVYLHNFTKDAYSTERKATGSW